MNDNDQDKSRTEAHYDKLASRFKELYLAGKERSRESMAAALDKAHEQLSAVGEFSTEQGQKLKQYLARDLDQVISDAQQLGEEAKERFHPALLLAKAIDCAGIDTEKFAGFKLAPARSKIVMAPLFRECLANIECKVVDFVRKHNIVVLEGVAACIDTARKDKRTVHAVGDGTFIVAGRKIGRRKMMAAKIPFGV